MPGSATFKILVTGDQGVGKSALVVKYLTGRFIWEYQSDHDSVYKHKIHIENEDISLEILDSVKLIDNCIRWADGFIIVYDVTNIKSFEKVVRIKQEIENAKGTNNLVFVVAGTKSDLSHSRRVSQEMSEECAQKIVAAHYECSACAEKTHNSTTNINKAFKALCRDMLLHKQLNVPYTRRHRRSSLSQIKIGIRNLVSSNRTKSNSVSVPPSLPLTCELTQSTSHTDIYTKSTSKNASLTKRHGSEETILDRNSNEVKPVRQRRHALSSPNLQKFKTKSIVT